MVILDDIALEVVIGDPAHFDWMRKRIGKSVQWHVVAADAALCHYDTPPYSREMGER